MISDTMETEGYEQVLGRLQALCSRRECCSFDILRKATASLDGDSALAGKLLTSLQEDGFVDDGRYAAAFAREKSRLSGWGPAKITTALVMKGIPRDTARQALLQIDEAEAFRKMVSVMEAKYASLRGDPNEKFKLLRFALGRGYDYEAVAPVVERLVSGLEAGVKDDDE